MQRYVENNASLIYYFLNYYKDGFSAIELKNDILNGQFQELDIKDLYRFRIFLDSCMMLFNKEKLEKEYFKLNFRYLDFKDNKFSFDITQYYDKIKNYDLVKGFEKKFGTINYNDNPLAVFYPAAEKRYDEVARVRISFAHMQYGDFMIVEELGIIPLYLIYNKDKNKMKNYGIAFEPVIHDFISRYYSNQAIYGIPYKHTFFCYSDEDGNQTDELYFYEVTYIFDSDNKYVVSSRQHPMIKYINHQSGEIKELFSFLKSDTNFKIKAVKVCNEEEINQYVILNNLSGEEKNWLRKLLYDFDTSFSNFLLHLRQLIDILIDYSTRLILNELTEESLTNISARILEFEEDENDTVSFKTLFSVLLLYNLMARVEDDDFKEFEPNFLNINYFTYSSSNLVRWCNDEHYLNFDVKEDDVENLPKKFLLSKIRNAVAHGNFRLQLSNKDLELVLIDQYNGRHVRISVCVKDILRMFEEINWECYS